MIFNHLLTYLKNFKSKTHDMKTVSFIQYVRRGQIGLGTRIFGQFCIFMLFNHLLTCDKDFQPETHDMKIGLFLMDFESFR